MIKIIEKSIHKNYLKQFSATFFALGILLDTIFSVLAS